MDRLKEWNCRFNITYTTGEHTPDKGHSPPSACCTALKDGIKWVDVYNLMCLSTWVGSCRR